MKFDIGDSNKNLSRNSRLVTIGHKLGTAHEDLSAFHIIDTSTCSLNTGNNYNTRECIHAVESDMAQQSISFNNAVPCIVEQQY